MDPDNNEPLPQDQPEEQLQPEAQDLNQLQPEGQEQMPSDMPQDHAMD